MSGKRSTISCAGAAPATREVSVERGYDPRDFPPVCAAAIHAGMIAREPEIETVKSGKDEANDGAADEAAGLSRASEDPGSETG